MDLTLRMAAQLLDQLAVGMPIGRPDPDVHSPFGPLWISRCDGLIHEWDAA